MHDSLDNGQTFNEEAGSHNTAHLAEDIEGLTFPATKQEIMDYVKEKGKCPDKDTDIALLEKLPNDLYDSPTQMMAEVLE